MPRIVGIDIPKEKCIVIALTYIQGIGKSSSLKILRAANIDPNRRAKDLAEDEISRIASVLSRGYKVEGDLRRDVAANIKRLIEISAWRGLRHRKGLPVRGQRTRTNARTRKGPKKTVGVARKTTVKPGE
ncbi:MAG: 30S ribosomal protein S13 [Candidatus Omnitrophica bacterium]|nr:30S ribosomal protein S13 [Candidatus Omnitrophota bacterium]